MKNLVIKAEGLGKKYIIGHQSENTRYVALRDVVSTQVRSFWRKTKDLIYGRPIVIGDNLEEFWALRDLNFEIKSGESVGIVGRNGAGKSTLLKIISRVTEPSNGQVTINGRISSLLEVGTGFHPELTGRENIFLNGAILGMSRIDIRRKFDEIVDFAGVEKFLDTPVKRFSSGMYVRLAFAIAAHIEPEILVVDEVLAVGDIDFQKKCLGKMESVTQEGRTVLFVSHNMPMISSLCSRGILLSNGQLVFSGSISDVITKYYAEGSQSHVSRALQSEKAALIEVKLLNKPDGVDFSIHDTVVVRMKYCLKKTTSIKFVPNFHFYTANGDIAFISSAEGVENLQAGDYYADCFVPSGLLNDGVYFVDVALTSYPKGGHEVEFWDKNAIVFNVVDPMDERSNRYGYGGSIPGAVRPKLKWIITPA